MNSDHKPLVRIRRKKKEQVLSKSIEERTDLDIGLEELKTRIINSFGLTTDLVMDDIEIVNHDAILVYLESMIDSALLKETFLNKVMVQEDVCFNTVEQLKAFCKQEFGGSQYKLIDCMEDIVKEIVNGSIVIVIKHMIKAVSIAMPNTEQRSVMEPSTQTVIRGPKDSFVESISTNLSLIRRRIRNSNLRFETFTIGDETKTMVNIGYMKGIANEEIVNEVRRRLQNIKVAAIFESGNIEELIADKSFTPFPLALNTERPDSVAANLLDGKICILTDGTPFVLIVPAVMTDFFVISEDYYQNFMMGSFVRMIRYISFLIALITPAAYVGVLTFHHELLPTQLLLGVIAQREGVPFPVVVEVMLMELTFEILREAGVRMPRAIGQTVSIVGALVIGQAAAEAGIISNIMVIVVAITGIANFVSPVYSLTIPSRLLRFLLILLSACFGLYGVLLGIVFMVAHLSSLRSFGVPYLAPVAPFIMEDQKDVFFRFPLWSREKRPSYLRTNESTQVKKNTSPTPPSMTGEKKK